MYVCCYILKKHSAVIVRHFAKSITDEHIMAFPLQMRKKYHQLETGKRPISYFEQKFNPIF